MKIIGKSHGFTIIHLKRRFFLFFERRTKNIFIVELRKRKRTEEFRNDIERNSELTEWEQYNLNSADFEVERKHQGHQYLSIDELKDIYVRWEMKITPLHIILLILTFISTTLAGSMIQGINILSSEVWKGIYFSIPLLFILSCHEFGHIYAMWRYGVKSTFPYFIPAPNIVGTFGAIMVLRERVERASTIIKIGASGPIFGFIAAIPVTLIGIYLSELVKLDSIETEGFYIRLGSSLIFNIIEKIFFHNMQENYDIMLHPIAFAGWIGFFITAMNLIPIGQTDGGHIVFGLFPNHHRKISFILAISLFIIGFLFWYGWVIWGFLTIALGLRKIPFSPVNDVGKKEKLVAVISLIIFISTFMLSPISINY